MIGAKLATERAETLLSLRLRIGKRYSLVMLQIADLSYFENAPENKLISGAAGTIVTANAKASGASTNTSAFTSTTARLLPNNGSLSIGRGFAKAIGNDPSAEVQAAGFGDIVVGSTNSTPNISSKPVDVAHGVVVAIVLPSHK